MGVVAASDVDGQQGGACAGRAPLLPGSAAMPTELAQLVSDCVADSPSARPDMRHVRARILDVQLVERVR